MNEEIKKEELTKETIESLLGVSLSKLNVQKGDIIVLQIDDNESFIKNHDIHMQVIRKLKEKYEDNDNLVLFLPKSISSISTETKENMIKQLQDKIKK